MNVLFLTMSSGMRNVQVSGIYTDLVRKFRNSGHSVYIIAPYERRTKRKTELIEENGVHFLGVRTLNLTKTNVIEKESRLGIIFNYVKYVILIFCLKNLSRENKKYGFDIFHTIDFISSCLYKATMYEMYLSRMNMFFNKFNNLFFYAYGLFKQAKSEFSSPIDNGGSYNSSSCCYGIFNN